MDLSPHFTLRELTVSETAVRNDINNIPPTQAFANLMLLCNNILEPLRFKLNKPILITSGYRSPDLNKAIGGAANSQHIQGQAVDIHVSGMAIDDLFQFIKNSDLPYSQVIQEFSQWVHVSYDGTPRHEALTAERIDGKTVYTNA